MNLKLTEDQISVAETADQFLAKALPSSHLRALAADETGSAIDEPTWRRCAELGWLGLGVPEAAGGVGMGVPEQVMLFRELGRHLAPGPFLACTLGVHLAVVADDGKLAADIMTGRRRVGMALGAKGVDVGPDDLLLTVSSAGAALAEVRLWQSAKSIDPGVRLAKVAPGREVVAVAGAQYLDRARVLIAAQLLGIVEAVRDDSAQHARTRTQFGKPIGSFQAVKHRCADMVVAAYSTIGEVFQAAVLVEQRRDDASFHAACAYVLASRAARASTADHIQNLGAIGFTWEHDAHLYLKRAFVLERLLGHPRTALAAVLEPARHEFE